MRIALVTSELPGAQAAPCGGLGHYVQRLAAALAAGGHEAEVFVPADPGADLPAGVHAVGRGWPPLARWCARAAAHRLDLPIDCLVQSRALGAALARRHAQRPFAVAQFAHLGATAFGCPRGLPAVVRLSGWQPIWAAAGDGAVGGVQADLTHRLEAAALRRARLVYAPSHHLAAAVGAAVGRRVAVLENPFALECEPAPAPVLEGRYVLTCGTISRLKGATTIARCAAAVLRADPGLRWVLAGREAQAGSLERIRAAAGADAARVLHLPHLGHPELYRLMRDAAVVALPSLVDNLPNTCLEALALGACVVGTQPTGMEQVIADGISGFLVPAGDDRALARAVLRALGLDAPARAAIGQAARRRMQELRPELQVPRLIGLYRRAAGVVD